MQLAIRWTIGNVSPRGYEALALSIAGAHAIFGETAEYVVCVNTIQVSEARSRAGAAARLVNWRDCSSLLPAWLEEYLDANMAEGVAWKFAPLRVFPDRHLLSLDNDVILWRMPDSVQRWIRDAGTPLIAEDVRCCYGQFAALCPNEPRNSGITGLPPDWDLEAKLRQLLQGIRLGAEGDEQGLQVAMITSARHHVVGVCEVSVNGYFRPHLLELGSCGAHFVGVNAKHSEFTWQGRPSVEFTHQFWDSQKPEIERRVHVAAVHPYTLPPGAQPTDQPWLG